MHKGTDLTLIESDPHLRTDVGCIGFRVEPKFVRRTDREISDQLEGNVQPIGGLTALERTELQGPEAEVPGLQKRRLFQLGLD